MNKDKYLYHDVVITPFYSPIGHWELPSLVGGVSLEQKYLQHYEYYPHCAASLETKILKPRNFIKEPCIYGGFLFAGYGHFIRESLAYLYFIKLFDESYPIVFSYSSTRTVLPFQRELFDFLNIRNKIIIINEITSFSSIYCAHPGSLLNLSLIDDQKEALSVWDGVTVPGKSLYISRKNMKGRTILNEEVVEKILLSYGWDIIYPEQMSIRSQLHEYSTAEKIVTVCGSALYSLLFLRQRSPKVFVLPRNHGSDYEILGNIYGNNYHLIDLPKYNITGKGSAADKSYEIDLGLLTQIIKETDNLESPHKSTYIRHPNAPKIDYHQLPSNCFLKKPLEQPQNSLFWLINYALNTHQRVQGAKKALHIMLKNNWMQPFMILRCYEFLISHAQEYLLLFHHYCKRLKINKNSPIRLDTFRNTILDSFALRDIDPFSACIGPSYKERVHSVSIESHISNLGWIGGSPEGWINGDPTGKNRIEAIRCRTKSPLDSIFYRIKTVPDGWLEGCDGKIAGTTGKSRPICGIMINYRSQHNPNMLQYRVRMQRGIWSDWIKNGFEIEFPQTSISAIHIRFRPT